MYNYSTEQLLSNAMLGSKPKRTCDTSVNSLEAMNKWNLEIQSIESEIDTLNTLYSLETKNNIEKVAMYKKINKSMFNGVDRGMESTINKCVLSLEDDNSEKKDNIFKKIWDAIVRFFKFIGEKLKAFGRWIKGLFTGSEEKRMMENLATLENNPELLKLFTTELTSEFNKEDINNTKSVISKFGGDVVKMFTRIGEATDKGIAMLKESTQSLAKQNKAEELVIGGKSSEKQLKDWEQLEENFKIIKDFNPMVYLVVKHLSGNKLDSEHLRKSIKVYQKYVDDVTVKITHFQEKCSEFSQKFKDAAGKVGKVAIAVANKCKSWLSKASSVFIRMGTSIKSLCSKISNFIAAKIKSGKIKKQAKQADKQHREDKEKARQEEYSKKLTAMSDSAKATKAIKSGKRYIPGIDDLDR